MQTVVYYCSHCNFKFKQKYNGWYPTWPCKNCRKEAHLLTNDNDNHLLIKRHRDAVAFGQDTKTGRPLAIDKHGNKFDPSETRYNLERDEFGWGATGKKPVKKTYHI